MVNTCLDVFFGAIQSRKYNPNITPPVPSGKRLHNYGKIHHFSWVNPLFLWPFSIAFSVSLPGRVINIYIYIHMHTYISSTPTPNPRSGVLAHFRHAHGTDHGGASLLTPRTEVVFFRSGFWNMEPMVIGYIIVMIMVYNRLYG